MKNNNIKKVGLGIDGHASARFNASRVVHTSQDFGDMNVLCCQHMEAHDKFEINVRKQIRAQTLLRPVAGGMKIDTYGFFVPKASACPHYDAMMSGIPVVNSNGQEVIPQAEPSIPANMLYLGGALIGAKSRLWIGTKADDTHLPADTFKDIKKWHHPKAGESYDFTSHLARAIGTLTNSPWTNGSGSIPAYSVDYFLYGTSQFSGGSGRHGAVNSGASFYGALVPCGSTNLEIMEGDDSINPSNADFVFYFKTRSIVEDSTVVTGVYAGANGRVKNTTVDMQRWFAWCFKFSDVGKRWVKLIRGLGYGTDAADYTPVSLTRLFGAYEGYWKMFGVRLYENFETTALSRIYQEMKANQEGYLVRMVEQNKPKSIADEWAIPTSKWWDFVRDCCEMWYTDSQDFVSAHTANVTPVANATSNNSSLMAAFATQGFVDINRINSGNPDGAAYQFALISGGGNEAIGLFGDNGQLGNTAADVIDHRILKIMHKWTNRQSVLGLDIAETLRAQGFGKYVEESGIGFQFVGHQTLDLETQDVTSLADSYDVAASGEGARLGDQGGKSITTQKDGETWSWETDVDGFLYIMSVIIPDGGYCQQIDPTVRCNTRWNNYQSEFDGLGYELARTDEIVSGAVGATSHSGNGTAPGSDPLELSTGSPDRAFGYRPRATGFKVSQNIVNGDFMFGSVRDENASYHLEKMIDLGRGRFAPVAGASHPTLTVESPVIGYGDIPEAGVSWRYGSRYKWLCNYLRIFANDGSDSEEYKLPISMSGDLATVYNDLTYRSNDHFLVFCIMPATRHSAKKPVEVSFDTYDEEKGANGFVGKA